MIKKTSANAARKRRHVRIRQNVVGTPERPRLNIFRSNTGLYVQIIDDVKQHTLVSASTKELKLGSNMEAAEALGEAIAKKAVAAGITQVVFDRGGYLYHGRVKALADKARAAGLEF